MAISLQVTGNGLFQGSSTALTAYNVTEDATPVEASDNTGGTGIITFSVMENTAANGTIMLLNDSVQLTDGSNGVTSGIVYSVADGDGIATISANARTNAFVANVKIAPYTGTLGGALTYYMSMVGITSAFIIDTTITGRAVSYQGFMGSVWDFLKQVLVAQQCEVSLVSNNIVFRPIRTRTLQMAKNSKVTRLTVNSGLAQTVQTYYYNNTWNVNGVCYPANGLASAVSAYQVDAGAVLMENISVNASLQSVSQPTCISSTSVPSIYAGTSSIYTVAGQDGTPILPSAWTGNGGSITVSVGQDQTSIDLKIVAATGLGNAPYTIGVSNGGTNYYAGLFIVGTGTFFTPTLLTVPTGSPLAKTATVIGTTVNNRFVNTLADASSVALRTAQQWAAPQQTISVTATVVNRPGDKGDVSYPTFAQVDTSLSPKTFAQVDTLYTGMTFAQVNAIQQLLVVNNFENQAFGNIAGARVLYQQAYYRVSTAQITQDGISYTAAMDTIFSDVDSVWAGKTFAQFNARWSGMTFQDVQVIPLWT